MLWRVENYQHTFVGRKIVLRRKVHGEIVWPASVVTRASDSGENIQVLAPKIERANQPTSQHVRIRNFGHPIEDVCYRSRPSVKHNDTPKISLAHTYVRFAGPVPWI